MRKRARTLHRAATVGVVGVVAVCAVELRAAQVTGFDSTTFEPFSFIHASDSQIGFSGSIADDRDRFILQGQQASQWGVPFVLLAGDLVDDYTVAAQVSAFDQGLATYQVPTFLVPGNHDIDTKSARTIYQQRYGADYYKFVYNNTLFVGLNSELWKRPSGYYFDADAKQFSWLRAKIGGGAAAAYDHIFVWMHHPPFVATEDEPETPQNLPLGRRAALMALFREANITALLTGHLHANHMVTPDDNAFPIIVAPGTSAIANNDPFGYHVFSVTAGGYSQQFHNLSDPVPVPVPGGVWMGGFLLAVAIIAGAIRTSFSRASA